MRGRCRTDLALPAVGRGEPEVRRGDDHEDVGHRCVGEEEVDQFPVALVQRRGERGAGERGLVLDVAVGRRLRGVVRLGCADEHHVHAHVRDGIEIEPRVGGPQLGRGRPCRVADAVPRIPQLVDEVPVGVGPCSRESAKDRGDGSRFGRGHTDLGPRERGHPVANARGGRVDTGVEVPGTIRSGVGGNRGPAGPPDVALHPVARQAGDARRRVPPHHHLPVAGAGRQPARRRERGRGEDPCARGRHRLVAERAGDTRRRDDRQDRRREPTPRPPRRERRHGSHAPVHSHGEVGPDCGASVSRCGNAIPPKDCGDGRIACDRMWDSVTRDLRLPGTEPRTSRTIDSTVRTADFPAPRHQWCAQTTESGRDPDDRDVRRARVVSAPVADRPADSISNDSMSNRRWKPAARSVALHGRDREASRSPRHTATDVRPGRPHRSGLEPAGTTEFLSSVCTSCSFVLRSFYVDLPRTAGGHIRTTDNEPKKRREHASWHNKRSSARRSA